MKVKCPHCGNTFESLEHPEPILRKEIQIQNYSSGGARVYGARPKSMGMGFSSVSSMSSAIDTNKPLPTNCFTEKKGYKEIFETIDNHQGATWTELKTETNISTSTLSKRLTEGKQAGIIDEEIRRPEGKKVYVKK